MLAAVAAPSVSDAGVAVLLVLLPVAVPREAELPVLVQAASGLGVLQHRWPLPLPQAGVASEVPLHLQCQSF